MVAHHRATVVPRDATPSRYELVEKLSRSWSLR